MPLSELIIDGFKSFAEKTKIHFEQGITGIVGPNGSGKSNITEAIRFAMGESRTKSMRGNNLADLIFAGSEKRKPLDRAAVTLIFDNRSRDLDFDSDEVTVTRRIFRNGENDYLINGRDVRLKDVRALFLDSGLTPNSLAIISQGRVDQILNSKAEDRRGIFEEAAGVLHFKKQKQAAAQQLAKTKQNLVRINDLVQELQKRLTPLAEQNSLAKEYKFEKAGLDRVRKSLLAFQIQTMNDQQQDLAAQAHKNKQLLAKFDHEVKTARAASSKQQENYQKLQAEQKQKQARLAQLTNQLSELKTRAQVTQQSQRFNQATKSEYQEQVKAEREEISNLKQQLNTLAQEKKEEEAKKEQLQKKRQQLTAQVSADPDSLAKSLEKQRGVYIDLLQQETTNNNHLLFLRIEEKRLQASHSEQDEENRSELQQAQTELKAMQAQGADLEGRQQKLQALVMACRRTEKKLTNQVTQLQRQSDLCQTQLQKLGARREALQNIQKRHQGYYYGVRNVLNHQQLFPGVIGVIGELIVFPVTLEAAMTTALGGSVQDLVTVSRDSARQAINHLKQDHAGRATFLPLDGLRVYRVPSSTITSLQAIDGFKGVASQMVTSKKQADIQAAIDYLLGNVLIVDTIETAMRVSRRVHRYRIVTLDGDVIAPGGSMTGGARNVRSNSPLQINAEINALGQQSKEKEKACRQKERAWQAKRQELLAEQAKKQRQEKRLHTLAQEINKAALAYQSRQKETARLRKACALSAAQQKRRQQQIQKLHVQIKQKQKDKANLQRQLQAAKAEMAATQTQIQNFSSLNQTVQSKINQLEPQIAVYANKLENMARTETERRKRLRGHQKQLTQLKAKIEGLKHSNFSSGQENKRIAQKEKQLQTKHTQLTKQVNALAAKLGQANAQINRLEQVASRNYDLRKDAANTQEDLSVKLANLKNSMNQKLAVLGKDYALTFEAALAQAKGKNTARNRAALAKKVKLHRMSLADIGPVNLTAISEYQQVKQRYDFLNNQQNDLLKARADLQQSMSTLDNEVKNRFGQTFKQIAASFAKIFPLVFDGGHANLLLTDPDDLLQTGVEIVAQPPGKKLQRLSLLSGGERALTAITLLFAMLKVNPVPFCVLDEVEAALDDVNVARFAHFLRHYAGNTQFIVITHRQGTMQQADQLFGVVMQESGVSSVLSVSLKEIKDKVN